MKFQNDIRAARVPLFACLAALVLALSAPAQTASVRVVHGIPGGDIAPTVDPALPVDVMVNDAICLLSGFTFGTIAGPFTLPAGTYNIQVSLANTLEPCSGDAVIDADVPLGDGENASIVAHLTEMGAPTATKFTNDVSTPADGSARVLAHHAAAAPAVDITAVLGFPPVRVVVAAGATNGAQAAAEPPAGALTVGISAAGSTEALFIRVLRLREGRTYTVYAVGSLENGTFSLIAEPIGGLAGTTIRL